MSPAHSRSGKEKSSSLVFLIGPFLLLWAFFWLVPLIGSFEESLSLSPQLVGKIAAEEKSVWMNYERALSDGKFIQSLENTLIFVASTVAITLSIGFFLASALFGLPKLLRGFCLFLLLIPSLALPGTLASLFYLFFHGKSGALNQFLIIPLGLEPINWMIDPGWILPCLIFQSVWRWTGLITLLLYCGMRAIPSWQFEVARLEGATSWNRLSTIVYPGVKHLLFFGGIFLFVDGVAAFSGAYNLLGGSGGVLDAGLLFVTYAYQVAFPGGAGRFDLPLATAMCILVAVSTVFISWFCIHFHKQKHSQEW
jgi:ABC-type sugar transport system permease subunit